MKRKILVFGAALALVVSSVHAGCGMDCEGAKASSHHHKVVKAKKVIEDKAAKKSECKMRCEQKRASEKAKCDAKKAKHDAEKAKLNADREAKKSADKAKCDASKARHEAEKAKLKADKEAKKIADKAKCDAEKAKKDAERAAKKVKNKAAREARKAELAAEDNKTTKKVLPVSEKYAFLFKEPTWAFESLPYKKNDLISVSGRYQYAKKAYNSSNHSEDITKLFFGQAPIKIQDILLVSKLLKNGEAKPLNGAIAVADYYLTYLADEVISFKGEMQEWRASLDLARHLTKDISVGFQIPFVSRYHELNLQTDLSNANKTKIEGTTTAINGGFPALYNHSFTAFVEDVMYEKEIYYAPKTTVNGIGDVTAFFNYDIKSKHLEDLNVGVKLLFPTSRSRDVHKLWDAELGNGGFTEVAPYFSMLYANCSYFNPHFFAQAIYGVPAKVDRRVARVRNYDGSKTSQTISDIDDQDLEDLVLANQVKTIESGVVGQTVPFSRSDSLIKNFADQALRFKIQPGAALNLRVGNVFEKFITRKGFLDIFYDLYARGKDHVGSSLNTNKWDASRVTDNTYQIAHKICLNLQHQFDKHARLELGGKYTFAGRNVPITYEANAALRLDF